MSNANSGLRSVTFLFPAIKEFIVGLLKTHFHKFLSIYFGLIKFKFPTILINMNVCDVEAVYVLELWNFSQLSAF